MIHSDNPLYTREAFYFVATACLFSLHLLDLHLLLIAIGFIEPRV